MSDIADHGDDQAPPGAAETLSTLLDEWDQELGAPSEELLEWADDMLGLRP